MENSFIQIPDNKPSLLERFGLYYLDLFRKLDHDQQVFELSDTLLTQKVNRITFRGILLSSVIGILCVFPTVWVDVYFTDSPVWEHYGWVAGVTLVSILIEFYFLFIIALKAVHEVSDLVNLHGTQSELTNEGIFSVKHLLARAALELPDPELTILGIDPFKRISKKNLLILGLLYKAKIFVTNQVLKYALLFTVGHYLLGIPILYEALLVECFWNSVVIRRVVHEARLRLFGFALSHRIANRVIHEKRAEQLSPQAKVGCLRAIGNAVVMTQNYHPNMILLLMRFQNLLRITSENRYDDWELFIKTLQEVSAPERYFLLDLFTVAAAFDGKLSRMESEHLRSAYGEDYEIYHTRIRDLVGCLKAGKLHAAFALCRLDFEEG